MLVAYPLTNSLSLSLSLFQVFKLADLKAPGLYLLGCSIGKG